MTVPECDGDRDEGWVKLGRGQAARLSSLTVKILRPKQVVTFGKIDVDQYAKLLYLCYPSICNGSETTRTIPTKFSLTIVKLTDLGRKPEDLSLDRVIEVCAGYVGHAMKVTAGDRKRFGRRVAEADHKRRGGELGGRAGYGS